MFDLVRILLVRMEPRVWTTTMVTTVASVHQDTWDKTAQRILTNVNQIHAKMEALVL